MGKAKKDPSVSIPERILTQLRRADTIYLGACVVQGPGSWTRIGPTWVVPGVGWITAGAGVAKWGTQAGLAQLAGPTAVDAAPQLHALGWSIMERPNVVFAMDDAAVAASYMKETRVLTGVYDAWEAGGRL